MSKKGSNPPPPRPSIGRRVANQAANVNPSPPSNMKPPPPPPPPKPKK